MTHQISPKPDGGGNHTIEGCEGVCYRTSKEGTCLEQCPFLEVRQGWVEAEFVCTESC